MTGALPDLRQAHAEMEAATEGLRMHHIIISLPGKVYMLTGGGCCPSESQGGSGNCGRAAVICRTHTHSVL